MPGFLVRLAICALGLWLASLILPGVRFSSGGTLVAAAILLGLANAVVRPIFIVLTLPITVLTLGLFLLVVNAAMVGLVSWLLSGFTLAGFWSAFFTAAIVSVTGWFASSYIGPRGQVEVLVVENRS